jgi:hypothetical protein
MPSSFRRGVWRAILPVRDEPFKDRAQGSGLALGPKDDHIRDHAERRQLQLASAERGDEPSRCEQLAGERWPLSRAIGIV